MSVVEMDACRERYVGLLLDALQAQPELDVALCDRIERVLSFVGGPRKRITAPAAAPTPRRLQIADVIEAVAKRFGVEPEAMIGPRRTQPETTARQIAMRLCREMLGATYPAIGRAFNRDHATVIHACEVTEGMAIGDIREELADAFAVA